jgi:hypothetical protein
VKYGLWDRETRQWLGNGAKERGPNLYDDEGLARIAAAVCNKMLELPAGTVIAQPFSDPDLQFVGSIIAKHNVEDVLDEMMGEDQ